MSHFIRGYFDGDGCVTINRGIGKKGQQILKGINVIFTSGSRDFLEGLCKKACSVAKFYDKKVYDCRKHSRSYQLKYPTPESIKWFKFLYSNNSSDLFLKRKFDIFKKYFELRSCRIDKKVASILNSYKQGGVAKKLTR